MGSRSHLASMLAVVALAATAYNSGADAAAVDDEQASPETATTALFDDSVVHAIEVEFDEADYESMIETFVETGEKESIEATVTIDGITYERAGLRLKGNSSLAGLGGGFGPAGGGGGRPDGPTSSSLPQPGGGGPVGGIGPGGGATADEPEQLPWLIELDEFVDQSHDGYEDIVIRSNSSETALNEAVALDLLDAAGLASQEAMATSFGVNGSNPVLRLAIEHPDDDAWYERAFDDAAGALYKAESTGDWSYRRDDHEAYDEVFDQEGGEDVADLTPLIEFLQFINESDDATFASELPDRLDVDAFATYLAAMELVENFDDIDGPGNNAYLWWDAESEQFIVVPWDMNLAFGGAGGGFGPGQRPEGVEPPEDFEPGQMPEGIEPPEDLEPGQGRGGGFGGRSNPLVERFHANAEFEALYQERLTALRAELYGSDIADAILDSWVATLTEGATDLVGEDIIAEEADAIRERFIAE